ncbi:BUR1 [Candida jiufengensis]|uniref:BUR1 n=1 Tax=Candida jiufengensis TaxID=497108 RepID=UPI0022252CE2|nr:BUR1 [Candida jiufengensis]KAI5951546.1 BUR1 [Candida jiufengensis]
MSNDLENHTPIDDDYYSHNGSDEEEEEYVNSIPEMAKLTDYEIIKKLGQGTFGVVQKARKKDDGHVVAIKQLLNHSAKEGFPITALREITILKQMDHHNILNIEELIFEEPEHSNPTELITTRGSFYTVSPYMSSDLVGILENPKVTLKLEEIKCLMKQLLEGIQYIHEQNYLHRDIKAANILVDQNGVLKIADFGLARLYHGDSPKLGMGPGGGEKAYTALVVTRWYRPPEILLGERKYTTAVDLWGIGCVFAELFTGKPILVGKTDAHQAQIIFDLIGSPTTQWPDAIKLPNKTDYNIGITAKRTLEQKFEDIMPKSGIKLLSGFLTLDPYKRFNALDALQHEFFTESPLPFLPQEMSNFGECHEIDKGKFQKLTESNKNQQRTETRNITEYNGRSEPDAYRYDERYAREESNWEVTNEGIDSPYHYRPLSQQNQNRINNNNSNNNNNNNTNTNTNYSQYTDDGYYQSRTNYTNKSGRSQYDERVEENINNGYGDYEEFYHENQSSTEPKRYKSSDTYIPRSNSNLTSLQERRNSPRTNTHKHAKPKTPNYNESSLSNFSNDIIATRRSRFSNDFEEARDDTGEVYNKVNLNLAHLPAKPSIRISDLHGRVGDPNAPKKQASADSTKEKVSLKQESDVIPNETNEEQENLIAEYENEKNHSTKSNETDISKMTSVVSSTSNELNEDKSKLLETDNDDSKPRPRPTTLTPIPIETKVVQNSEEFKKDEEMDTGNSENFKHNLNDKEPPKHDQDSNSKILKQSEQVSSTPSRKNIETDRESQKVTNAEVKSETENVKTKLNLRGDDNKKRVQIKSNPISEGTKQIEKLTLPKRNKNVPYVHGLSNHERISSSKNDKIVPQIIAKPSTIESSSRPNSQDSYSKNTARPSTPLTNKLKSTSTQSVKRPATTTATQLAKRPASTPTSKIQKKKRKFNYESFSDSELSDIPPDVEADDNRHREFLGEADLRSSLKFILSEKVSYRKSKEMKK